MTPQATQLQHKINAGNAESIYFASFLGDNAFDFYRQVVGYLGKATGLPTQMVAGLPPAEQDRLVDEGKIHAVFTCGLPYVRKAGRQPPRLRLLAAPVLAARRYRNRPIYYSDVIVHADSPVHTFEDLQGATFAYNEGHSLSGYVLPCYHLLTLGKAGPFFKEAVQSGSHAVSMDWVESGRVTAAAIDSVVLAMELEQRPERAKKFRVVEAIGPAPMPPVAASGGLVDPQRTQLQQALLSMHTYKRGQAILRRGGLQRFAPVNDADYNGIRQMIQALEQAGAASLC